ncbi:MarR family winged helix-turn-helix transcriptional regulator [Roseicella sp. DB1501]|uniref:MarR family winged helix-turn-helix transcriptional regulator n=1 Tax=Roseicella sp. DB1501 TaxID=2730925 RepID=UPI0014924068|nr:MarR family transcriptional regulator [Roseicella sp. DB1501]NOG72862.1 MarR family transcriptional regulator [Roseicella sp. DB1501]
MRESEYHENAFIACTYYFAGIYGWHSVSYRQWLFFWTVIDMSQSLANPPHGRFIDDYLLYLLARTSHLISAEFHELLRRKGISVPVWRVLASLVGSPGETVTGLAETCLLQQPTMTKLLDRMVRDGLVKRAQDTRDRRVVRVALTARGEMMAADLVQAAKLHEAEVLARHPETEAVAIKDLLRAIVNRQARPRRG